MKRIFLYVLNVIFVFPGFGFSQQSNVITGRISDGVLPIVGARVMILADTVWVTTDSTGKFILPTDRYQGDPAPVTAGKKGWFNGGWQIHKGENVDLTLEAVPKNDNPNYHWIDPEPAGGGMMGMMGGANNGACGNCHSNYYDLWEKSEMATTTHNPWVLDQYETAGAIKSTCADCHAPAAAVHNPGNTDLEEVADIGGVEAKGVSCDVCHKTSDVDVSIKPGVQTMHFTRLVGPSRRIGMMGMDAVVAYGPLADVVTQPMAASFNSTLSSSKYCSSCHLDGRQLPAGKQWDYKSVYPDAKSEEFQNGSVVPNQWTYYEWKNWQDGLVEGAPNKGQTCQDCHMNWTQELLPYDHYIAEGQGHMMESTIQKLRVRRDPSTIHPHTFEGANKTRLQNSAYLYLRPSSRGNNISVMTSVTNTNTGHRLPTGVTFRNILLVVSATDSTGKVLPLKSGSTIPNWGGVGDTSRGNYAGLPGIGYARITADDRGNLNVPFWEATKIVSDNRLRPREADSETFEFDGSNARNYVKVTAKLIYRRAFKPMADKYGWDTKDILMEEKSETVYLQ